MQETGKLKWDLRNTPYDKVFDLYPELQKIYQEVVQMQSEPPQYEPLHAGQLMQFIVFSYDLNSPIAREASIYKRRAEALKMIGIPLATAGDVEKYRAFIGGQNSFVNHLAIHFCKLQNSFDWIELCSLQDILDDVDRTLKEETEGTEKKSAQEILKLKLEIREKSQKLREEMRSIAQRLFFNDGELLNFSAAHSILEKRIAIISPERLVAKDREEAKKRYEQAQLS